MDDVQVLEQDGDSGRVPPFTRKEITPRLEEAARRDSKNVPLQYVLADRYREIGQTEKADALYKSLLTSQPNPQTYRALAASLLLFGLGVSFRWNILAYGLVIVVDLLVSSSSSMSFGSRMSRAAVWGVLALLVSFLMIDLSGYSFRDLLAALPRASYVINQAGTQAPAQSIL